MERAPGHPRILIALAAMPPIPARKNGRIKIASWHRPASRQIVAIVPAAIITTTETPAAKGYTHPISAGTVRNLSVRYRAATLREGTAPARAGRPQTAAREPARTYSPTKPGNQRGPMTKVIIDLYSIHTGGSEILNRNTEMLITGRYSPLPTTSAWILYAAWLCIHALFVHTRRDAR